MKAQQQAQSKNKTTIQKIFNQIKKTKQESLCPSNNQKLIILISGSQQQQKKFKRGRIVKILSPQQYIIKDSETQELFNIQIQLKKSNINNKSQEIKMKNYFYHLLKVFAEDQILYLPFRNKNQLSNTLLLKQEDFKKGSIYLYLQQSTQKNSLKAIQIQNLFKQQQKIESVIQGLQKTVQQILQCFIVKVQGLKLILYIINEETDGKQPEKQIFVSFYFSELKLIKPQNMYAKTIWQKSQAYFKDLLEGQFVQIKVNGFQKYRQEVNIYGQILRRGNGQDLKQKIVADGFAELSKNGQKYLSQAKIQMYKQLAQKASQKKIGLWMTQDKKKGKSSNQQENQLKYNQWQKWYKQKKSLKDLKNGQDQLKKIIQQFKKLSNSKEQFIKGRQTVQIFMSLLDDNVSKFTINYLQQFIKILSNAFLTISPSTILNNQIQNQQFLKYLNKMLTCVIFYLIEVQKSIQNNQKQKKKPLNNNININQNILPLVMQLQRIIKFVFKLCFIGNDTFHQKIFGRKKQNDYQNFSFDATYLKGGISSYSQMSDLQDFSQKSNQMSKIQKKLISIYSKIRMNSTLLLSLVFKYYPTIVQNNWKICVTENILTQQFFNYLSKMSINADHMKMSHQQKKQIVNLMRTNFGQNSLMLLLVFEQNHKVKSNAISCITNMIVNFQGKKMIDTTQKVYIQKLLKQTKSSFVPKSFIIFSGLRNALYFMLFSLHYERNIQIIIEIFKALSELCYHSTLMDKMGFVQGMGLLMKNYISPVLEFSWQLAQLRQLKNLCVSFLGVLVSTQKKWIQIQENYLLSKEGTLNINCILLDLIQNQRKVQLLTSTDKQKLDWKKDKTVQEIIKYFTKLAKRYFKCLFIQIWSWKQKKYSVWSYVTQIYMQKSETMTSSNNSQAQPQHQIIFVNFVQEVYKCHFDQLIKIKGQSLLAQENEQQKPDKKQLNQKQSVYSHQQDQKIVKIVANKQLFNFLPKFIEQYSKILSNQNYISLLNTITYVDYDAWSFSQDSNLNFELPKKFVIHCFNSMKSKEMILEEQSKVINKGQKLKTIFSSLQNLKNNSLVRLSLIKLIGYMSFCPQFQKQPYINQGIKILLQCSRNYKSLNSIVKITWGLSNWAKLQNFSSYLSEKEISQFLEYFISHSKSDKQKIASNSTRGIGFFIKNVFKQYNLKKCRQAIINNLSHSIIKVRTNSTKTLRSMAKDLQEKQIRDFIPILQTNLLKNNYHLQIQTLHLIKDLGNPISKDKLLLRFSQILNDLNSHTTMEYQFSEIKAIKHLRRAILMEIVEIFRDDPIMIQKFVSTNQKEKSQNKIKEIKKEDYSSKQLSIQQISHILKQIFLGIINYLQDAKQQSLRKTITNTNLITSTQSSSQNYNENILRKASQRGTQAQKQVFNIQNTKQYDQQKTILTKATLNSLNFVADQKEIQLIKGLKQLSLKFSCKDLNDSSKQSINNPAFSSLSNDNENQNLQQKIDWQHLGNLKIEGTKISMLMLDNQSNYHQISNKANNQSE